MCVTKTHFYDTEEFACRSEGVRHLEKKVKMYTVFLWQQQRLTNKTGMWRGHTEQFSLVRHIAGLNWSAVELECSA